MPFWPNMSLQSVNRVSSGPSRWAMAGARLTAAMTASAVAASNPVFMSFLFLITHYPQLSRHGTKQEHVAVSAGLNDGAQQGAISKGAQRGPVCCSLWNRGSVPGGGDALALAIRLC